jgi:hydrogenase-1 operon protein HyaF
MTDLNFLADDGLVDTLTIEIGDLLRRLLDQGEQGAIDLLGLPLSPSCVAALEQRLGQGEITAVLDAAGRSELRETGFPGVWWTRHADEKGRVVAMLIEVAFVPEILRANIGDIALGCERLAGATHVARRQARAAG